MSTRSRPMPLESGPIPLEQKQKIVAYKNDFSAGTIAQIIVIVASAASIYSGIKSDQVKQQADLENVKTQSAIDRLQTKDALADLKIDVKELRASNNDIKESLAILRGRATDQGKR